jgi:hypothetical protein
LAQLVGLVVWSIGLSAPGSYRGSRGFKPRKLQQQALGWVTRLVKSRFKRV